MIWIVKHADDDYRMHRWRDGEHAELHQFDLSDWPKAADLSDGLADTHNGASILGDPDARRDLFEVLHKEITKINLTQDGQTVPWQ